MFFKVVSAGMAAWIVFLFCNNASAELPKKWKNQGVLYAEVREVKKLEKEGERKLSDKELSSDSLGEVAIYLTPLATLTGGIDAASQDELRVVCHLGRGPSFTPSVLLNAPKPGAKIIAWLHRNNDYYATSPERVEFFPENERGRRPAIFEVASFDDPKVGETMQNLRKMRAAEIDDLLAKPLAKPAQK
jgi:hypothetical protein